jgi:cytochrome c biogenesis protein CcmG, thiol:disulfide interchange protein DsbE
MTPRPSPPAAAKRHRTLPNGPDAPDQGRRRCVASVLGLGLPAGLGLLVAGHARGAEADPRLASVQLPDAAGRLRPVFDGQAAATLVDFWASWCTPCRQSFPWMNSLVDRLAGRGLRIVAVNLDVQRADADRFLQRHPARFEVVYDPAGDLARRVAVRGMPSSLLLDASGRVRWSHTGFRPSEAPSLEARITQALPPA